MPPASSPLSFAQRRLWFLDQLSPGTATYNVPLVLEIDGPLAGEMLERALREIVRRHEPLRTIFPAAGGLPRQEVLPWEPFSIAVAECAGDSQTLDRLDLRITEEVHRPFDLATGPVVRATLLRLTSTVHVLVLVIHHIAFDGWSSGVFCRELAALYSAFAQGLESPLAELTTTYRAYAARQIEASTGDAWAQPMAYWAEHLKLPRQTLMLPGDHARPAVSSHRGWRAHTGVAAPLWAALQALSRREGVTVFMTLLAAYAVLLETLTGQQDVIVGTPIANRTQPDVEPLIGFFVNTVALRLDLSGDPSFRGLLQQAKRVAVGAFSNQDLPFERIVEVLKPERSLDHEPIVQTLLALDVQAHAIGEPLPLGDLVMRRRAVALQTAKFDMMLVVRPRDSVRRVTLELSADLFDEPAAGQILGMMTPLLEGLVSDPERSVGSLPRLGPRDRRQMTPSAGPPAPMAADMRARLLAWAGRDAPYPRDRTVASLFEAHARETPDAPAISGPTGTVTYRELNERANQLAHALRALDVTRQGDAARTRPVGVLLERSADAIVALLAILKAGGAYLPLDPAWPPARLAALLDASGAAMVVTRQDLTGLLAPGSHALVRLDADAERIAAQPTAHLEYAVAPDALAYVLFTSGTTGTPKAVGVPHRAIVRLVYGMDIVDLDARDTVMQLAPLSFDAATFEIWGPLLRGGRVAVSAEPLLSAPALASFIADHQVTVMWLTASLFNAVVDEDARALGGLRSLLIGGETLSVPHVERALAALPTTRLFNGYGPTETTTFATLHEIRREDLAGSRSIPIGRPLANTRVYVLEPAAELSVDADTVQVPALVPVGESGELWIGGDGVALGYVNDAPLTAAKFVADPFDARGGARVYRTGDRVRFRDDGVLAFLGRFDDQVKLRGFRIEPREIEAAIDRHPRVARSAVALAELPAVGKALVAAVVPRAAEDIAALQVGLPGDLRAFLRELLPEHMVPSRWLVMTALPLAASGKTDRHTLAALAGAAAPVTLPPRALSTRAEEAIAGIWQTVLDRPSVGADDNFFDLGGQSLLATQVMSRMHAAFGFDVGLRAMFTSPTVAGLARIVDQRMQPDGAPAPPAAAGLDERHPVPAGSHETKPATVRSHQPIRDRPPGSTIAQRLAGIWRQVLGVPDVLPEDDFFALGGHSLLAVQLFAEIAHTFGVRLPLSTLFRDATLAAQARLIATDADRQRAWSPIVALQPKGSRAPFFLVHGIGGEVLSFDALARHLGDDQPFYGIQADWRDEDAQATNIEGLSRQYIEAMRAIAPTGPYRLGGYSFGGVIAFEMAQQLLAQGERVALLAMLDAGPPGLRPAALTPAVIWRVLKNAAYWPIDDEFLRSGWLVQRARLRSRINTARRRGAGQTVTEALDAGADVRDLLGVWRLQDHARGFLERFIRMRSAYRPQPYAGAITVFRARTLSLSYRGPADLGWGTLVRAVTTRVVPGAHDTILKDPDVKRLATLLSAALESCAGAE